MTFLKSLSEKAMNRAKEHGVIRTWLGRKCRFDMYEPVSYGFNRALPMEQAIKEYGSKELDCKLFAFLEVSPLDQRVK